MILRNKDERGERECWSFGDESRDDVIAMEYDLENKYIHKQVFTDITRDEAIKIMEHFRVVFGLARLS